MASSPMDVRGMQAAQMIKRLAGAGPGAPAPGGPGGGDAAGQQLSQQLSELKGADPQLLTKAVEQLKSMALAVQVRTAFQVPDAARHLAKIQVECDAALKSLQQAAATVNTVSSPIVNQAGMSPNLPQPEGGAGGGSPMPAEGMMP